MATLHGLGKRYRYILGWDEAREGRDPDPALQILPGAAGHIFVWGEGLYAFSTTRARAIKLRREIPGVEFVQEGDDGVNATFPTAALPKVAKVLRIKKRRKPLSDERRRQLVEAGSQYRYEARGK